MPEEKTLNEDLFYKGSSANLPRLHTCENKTPFWDKSKVFASQGLCTCRVFNISDPYHLVSIFHPRGVVNTSCYLSLFQPGRTLNHLPLFRILFQQSIQKDFKPPPIFRITTNPRGINSIGCTLLYFKMDVMPLVPETKMADVSLGNLLTWRTTWLVPKTTFATLPRFWSLQHDKISL